MTKPFWLPAAEVSRNAPSPLASCGVARHPGMLLGWAEFVLRAVRHACPPEMKPLALLPRKDSVRIGAASAVPARRAMKTTAPASAAATQSERASRERLPGAPGVPCAATVLGNASLIPRIPLMLYDPPAGLTGILLSANERRRAVVHRGTLRAGYRAASVSQFLRYNFFRSSAHHTTRQLHHGILPIQIFCSSETVRR